MRIGQIAIDIAPLRESRDFRRLFTGRFVSMAGNAVATTAADWQVYGLTHNSLAVGLLTLASSAGMLIGLLAGGMLADRHDRRTLLMAVRLPQAVLAALLMVNSLLSHPALWPLVRHHVRHRAAVRPQLPGIDSGNSGARGRGQDVSRRRAQCDGQPARQPRRPRHRRPADRRARAWLAATRSTRSALRIFGLAMIGLRPMPPTIKAQRPGLKSLG